MLFRYRFDILLKHNENIAAWANAIAQWMLQRGCDRVRFLWWMGWG
ncbi:MAG: hypothetical protein HC852_02040 [Acaryochloridaceae cyanobacterium RU_4_10]|nr:hypothetical protein [Acaryochloridaceae cyanobacterium RU_4_10]